MGKMCLYGMFVFWRGVFVSWTKAVERASSPVQNNWNSSMDSSADGGINSIGGVSLAEAGQGTKVETITWNLIALFTIFKGIR